MITRSSHDDSLTVTTCLELLKPSPLELSGSFCTKLTVLFLQFSFISKFKSALLLPQTRKLQSVITRLNVMIIRTLWGYTWLALQRVWAGKPLGQFETLTATVVIATSTIWLFCTTARRHRPTPPLILVVTPQLFLPRQVKMFAAKQTRGAFKQTSHMEFPLMHNSCECGGFGGRSFSDLAVNK